jgi:hypothetical protein
MITVFVFNSDHKVKVKPEVAAKRKAKGWVENNPLVNFFYPEHGDGPDKYRLVRLISADERYLLGLDVYDKNRTKKFLRENVRDLKLLEFNPAALNPTKKPKNTKKEKQYYDTTTR